MNTLKLKNSIFKIFIELFIFNKKTRSKIKSRWAKLHLKEHVDFAIKNTQIPANLNEDNNIIWQYWHQSWQLQSGLCHFRRMGQPKYGPYSMGKVK